MYVRKPAALAVAGVLAGMSLIGATSATAAPTRAAAETPAKVTVVAKGLNGPRELSSTSQYFYVAQSDTGIVARVNKSSGATKNVVTGVSTLQGVLKTNDRFYLASGEAAPDSAPGASGGSKLLVAKTYQKPKTFANLLSYELKYNPDNQTQFGPDGKPLDALSNPYYVIRSRSKGGFLLVADAGANDVLAVSKKGTTSTFFVPPSVSTGACADVKNNTPAGNSCDAVPTGLAYGPKDHLYISALTSETPKEGRVYVVDKNGKLLKTLTGFSAPTGVAVGPDGSVYVSELLQGAPEGDGPPPAGFDPSTVGQIVKVAPNGTRTYAQVTMPSGLLWTNGKLYASAWSIAGLLGIKDAGQVVSVDPSSFRSS